MTLGTAPDPAPNAHDAAAIDAADHVEAFLTAYDSVGLDRDEAFHLYCILAARPTAATL